MTEKIDIAEATEIILSDESITVAGAEISESDPEAVVTLVLNGVDINCDIAPAVIFYNVYECGSTEEADATNTVDTTAAGANVYILDGTDNNITGSHVARIYESYVLNEEGTEVVDSKKLHKYDAAFYSKMTMNVDGAENTRGVLNIDADNEGLDSELHLTINGGNINIESGNDGINTNEDGISVTTLNGGTLTAEANSTSMDGGIDSDMGIHINGGTVYATGNMLDRISESSQNYVVMGFAQSQQAGSSYELKNEENEVVASYTPGNNFSYMIMSNADISEGTYTFWQGETQLAGMEGEGGGMMMPGGFDISQMPEGMEIPKGMDIPEDFDPSQMPQNGGRPGNGEMPEGMEIPEGFDPSQMPENGEMPESMTPPQGGFGSQMSGELSKEFAISANGNYYSNVTVAEN